MYSNNVIVATLIDLEPSDLGIPPLQRFYKNQKLSQKALSNQSKFCKIHALKVKYFTLQTCIPAG